MDQLTIWGNFLWTPGFLPHLWFNNKISANQIIFYIEDRAFFLFLAIFGGVQDVLTIQMTVSYWVL